MANQIPLVVLGTSPNWTSLTQLKAGDRLAGIVNHVDFGANSVMVSAPSGEVASTELAEGTVLANVGGGAAAVTLSALGTALGARLSLGQLADVDIAGISGGDTIVYNAASSKFEAAPGGISGLADVRFSAAAEGDTLRYDQSEGIWRTSPDAPRNNYGYVRKNGVWEVENSDRGAGGYEFTGGFAARVNEQGQSGANDFGNFVAYTQGMADTDTWMRFGFGRNAQVSNDVAYWSDPDPLINPNFDQTRGLFGGLYMPLNVTDLFDFEFEEDPGFSAAYDDGTLRYTAAEGSFDFRQCIPGDMVQVRFDFNIKPQVGNTTVEIGLIWQTRDADGNPTFTFPLTTTPMFYGPLSAGRTYLNRPFVSAYLASNEDVNARALLAVRADNPIQVAPLTTLAQIQR